MGHCPLEGFFRKCPPPWHRNKLAGFLSFGSEREDIAQLFQTADMMPLDACGIELIKVISSQIRGGFLVLQDVIEIDQDFVRERHDGFVFPTTVNPDILRVWHHFGE